MPCASGGPLVVYRVGVPRPAGGRTCVCVCTGRRRIGSLNHCARDQRAAGRVAVVTRGGGGGLPAWTRPPPLYGPQNGCMGQWILWAPEAPEILFEACGRE